MADYQVAPKRALSGGGILKLLTKFKGIASVSVQVYFSRKIGGITQCPDWSFQNYTLLQKNKAITLQKVYHQNGFSNLFHLPLSVEAYAQVHHIVHMIHNLNLTKTITSRTTFGVQVCSHPQEPIKLW